MGNDKIVYMETAIESGMERHRIEFKRGDVAFLPSASSICFFIQDVKLSKSMTPIGRLVGDIGHLESAGTGSTMLLYEDAA